MHSGKYQCHITASWTYTTYQLISQLPNKSHIKKQQQFLRILENFHGKGQEKGWLISLQITLEDSI